MALRIRGHESIEETGQDLEKSYIARWPHGRKNAR